MSWKIAEKLLVQMKKEVRSRPLGVKLLLLLVGLFTLTLAALLAGSAQLTHDRMIGDRVSKLQAVVEITHDLAQLLEGDVAAGRLTRPEAIDQFRTFVYEMRYSGGDYLFSYDLNGTVIALGNDPEAQGQDRFALKDVKGRLFVQELRAAALRGGGMVEYWYPRKPGTPPAAKLSYVQAFMPWNMFIGTGVYNADIEASFNTYLLNVGMVLLGVLVVAGGMALLVGRDLLASMSERRAAEVRIIHLAHHDTLTDLPNRALLQDRLSSAVWRANQDPSFVVALLLCDLDRFKEVNDTFGHPAGDELLRQAAERMRASVRKDDIVARLGGDEFALLQMGDPQPRAAESLAARIVDAMSGPFQVQGHTITVGASVGIALAPTDARDTVGLMKHADTALYVSKSRGRGRATVYRPEMSEELQERHALEGDLRRAFDAGEFVLHYQPLVDLHTRQVIGVEALIRWMHPTRGVVWPAAFIQAAEDCGLLVPLGAWVLRRACLDAAGWNENIRVAVNVSSKQFQAHGFFDVVRSALADAGLAADRLDLEIAESVMLKDGDEIRAVLEALRASGVRISLDDFGTGYASLTYLQEFPIDKIKIDRSFVSDLGATAHGEAIVRAMVSFGTALGLQMVAEGIETEDQADRVLAANCCEGQGYLFSRPVPASDVMDVIAKLGQMDAPDFDRTPAQPKLRLVPAASEVERRGDALDGPAALDCLAAPKPAAGPRV